MFALHHDPRIGMLRDIQDTVASYAHIVAKITGVDAEVVDADLTRIAGTGHYAPGVGQSIKNEGEIYRHVMRIRRTFMLDTPREHHICTRCPGRQYCCETFSLSTPVVDGDQVHGVIGLVCFTDADRARFMENRDTYTAFIEQCADFIVHKLRDHVNLNRAQGFLDLMLRILEVNTRGILVFNAKGGITYLNDVARGVLRLEETGKPAADQLSKDALPTDVHLRRTGETFSELEEFVMTYKGHEFTLVGQLVPLSPSDYHFASVFTFETLSRMASQSSVLGGGVNASGLDHLLGESPSMVDLKEQIRHIACSTSTVLITGESGTGKEMVARAIHTVGDRRDKSFIGLNCGAIPDTLLESELFGYTGGAFTGANSKGRIGKFELAHKGVLFLDEITTLPLYLQVKLLRVLQERAFTRLGSNRLIEVDIRIIAATNEDLSQCVAQGRFREDLYYRLNVIPLTMPPLRHRAGDLDLLASFFLEKYSRLFGKRTPTMTPAARAALAAYSWPGNVREFENTMEFMVNMMNQGNTLDLPQLPQSLRKALAAPPQPSENSTQDAQAFPFSQIPLLSLRDLEHQAITEALRRFGNDTGGKRTAAAALGIGMATLYRKIKEYGIE